MNKGYMWHVLFVDGCYYPNEKLFATYSECLEDAKQSEYYFQDEDNPHIGIDLCVDNNGVIGILKPIEKATKIFYESEE